MPQDTIDQYEINAANLSRLQNGRAGTYINHAIALALQDCEDRTNVDKPRTVQITLKFTPKSETGACLDGVLVDVAVKHTIPDTKLDGTGVARVTSQMDHRLGQRRMVAKMVDVVQGDFVSDPAPAPVTEEVTPPCWTSRKSPASPTSAATSPRATTPAAPASSSTGTATRSRTTTSPRPSTA